MVRCSCLTRTGIVDSLQDPFQRTRSDCADIYIATFRPAAPPLCDGRRRGAAVVAAAHTGLAGSYAAWSCVLLSRHVPAHSCDANRSESRHSTRAAVSRYFSNGPPSQSSPPRKVGVPREAPPNPRAQLEHRRGSWEDWACPLPTITCIHR